VGYRSTFFPVAVLLLATLLVWIASELSVALNAVGPAWAHSECSPIAFCAVAGHHVEVPTNRSEWPKGTVVSDPAILDDDFAEDEESRANVAWRHKASPTPEFPSAFLCGFYRLVPSASLQAKLIVLLCRLQC
jgi:hypothetical protein